MRARTLLSLNTWCETNLRNELSWSILSSVDKELESSFQSILKLAVVFERILQDGIHFALNFFGKSTNWQRNPISSSAILSAFGALSSLHDEKKSANRMTSSLSRGSVNRQRVCSLLTSPERAQLLTRNLEDHTTSCVGVCALQEDDCVFVSAHVCVTAVYQCVPISKLLSFQNFFLSYPRDVATESWGMGVSTAR